MFGSTHEKKEVRISGRTDIKFFINNKSNMNTNVNPYPANVEYRVSS